MYHLNHTTVAPLGEDAFHGLAGDVVRAILPETESSEAALLFQFLAGAGNALGRGPHALAEAARHGTNIFVCLVGDSSKGRKGTAWGRVQEPIAKADPDWAEGVRGGLSSGEGLITAVGSDKRLLVLETEFVSPLKMMSREGNVLSPILRQAWDHGSMATMTKHDPVQVSDAHISIVGHITRDELLRYLNTTELGNGFANRFLWVWSTRSKLLPEGGGIVDYPEVGEALDRARDIGLVQRDTGAHKLWAEVYPGLSEGSPGLFGSVTARSEAQVLRLSVLYAVLDGRDKVSVPHLKAALAVWKYSEDSARAIFSQSTGNAHADKILANLDTGLSKTYISNLFQRNVSKVDINTALELLRELGLARKSGHLWVRINS